MNDFQVDSSDSVEPVSDSELVERIGRRDREAFRELYERYYGFVSAICYRVCGQSGDAPSVVTVVFLEIWNLPNRYHPERGSFRTYIGLLSRSRARDSVRRVATENKHNRQTAVDFGRIVDDIQRGLDPVEQAADVETGMRIRAKLDTLPTESITVLTMSFYDGLSHREIAESLRLPLGTVKSRLRRALKLLGDRIRATNDIPMD